jgi:hypothetical protein
VAGTWVCDSWVCDSMGIARASKTPLRKSPKQAD